MTCNGVSGASTAQIQGRHALAVIQVSYSSDPSPRHTQVNPRPDFGFSALKKASGRRAKGQTGPTTSATPAAAREPSFGLVEVRCRASASSDEVYRPSTDARLGASRRGPLCAESRPTTFSREVEKVGAERARCALSDYIVTLRGEAIPGRQGRPESAPWGGWSSCSTWARKG